MCETKVNGLLRWDEAIVKRYFVIEIIFIIGFFMVSKI